MHSALVIRLCLSLLCGLAVLAARAADAPPVERPNIVLIISDDMGFSDLNCYGGNIGTPHLDALADGGVRFTQAYVSGPVCAPARAGLMTGRYQARFSYETLTGSIQRQIDDDYGVSTDEILLPQLLKDAGYTTAHIGKWHLGYNEKYWPNNRGVDHFFGFLPGGHDYFQWTQDIPHTPMGGPIYRNRTPVEGEGYLTHAFTNEAVRFISENADQPFFLCLAQFNVHSPFDVPAEYVKDDAPNPVEARRRGMVRALDESVGQVVAALRKADVIDRTLIVFINDNGSPFVAANAPLRGYKGSLFEGGIRVPMIFHGPGLIPAGSTFDQPVIALDLLPTFLSLAGGRPPQDRSIDGVDLLPHLAGSDASSLDRPLYWRYVGESAVRDGNWKLHHTRKGELRLVNLADDPAEQHNLAEAHPAKAQRLASLYQQWEQSVLPAAE